MSTQSILRTPTAELIPQVANRYLDVHRVMAGVLKEIMPHEEVPPSNVMLNSEHGLGKTLLAATLALELGESLGMEVPLIVFDCSEDTREYHLIGMPTPVGGGDFAFQLGPFPLAIEVANETGLAILLAEEISALPPGTQKTFNRMTDWRRGIYVPAVGKVYQLVPEATVIVMGTMNPATYQGVYTLNDDLRSRFQEFALPRPSQKDLRRIFDHACGWAPPALRGQVAQLIHETRSDATDYSMSTRDGVNLLKSLVRQGDNREFALRAALNRFSTSEERKLVADRIDGIFSTTLKSSTAGFGVSYV